VAVGECWDRDEAVAVVDPSVPAAVVTRTLDADARSDRERPRHRSRGRT
jgi:hypothetical protein